MWDKEDTQKLSFSGRTTKMGGGVGLNHGKKSVFLRGKNGQKSERYEPLRPAF